MATYTMETRKRVVDYLNHHRKVHTQKSLQYLGGEHKRVHFESLKLILKDLKEEGFIEFTDEGIRRVADGKSD